MTFEDDESVEKALDTSLAFRGEQLKMQRAKKPTARKRNVFYVQGVTKLFIGALPSKLTYKEFKGYFEKFGEVEDICLPMKDKIKGINRGHGFVNFANTESARRVIESKTDHHLREKWIDIKIAKPRSEKSPNFNAFNSSKTDVFSYQSNKNKRSKFKPSTYGGFKKQSKNFLELKRKEEPKKKKEEEFKSYKTKQKLVKKGLGNMNYNDISKRLSEQVQLNKEEMALINDFKKRFSLKKREEEDEEEDFFLKDFNN